MAEVSRRRELAPAHPELLEPWDGTIDASASDFIRRRFSFGVTGEFGRQKTSLR
jgi:hypothetical protein